uniref:Uncharacterized protein n=1 Tax=Euplotes crassus TaxID=5936 RepID=A0A7S3NXB4_EUPCR|mmetsp:Transcript_31536/g.31024  ORF Transcript_31536/g.31024 Transcript_31536/m.31024 type:complete len:125 (+) Transcript_31536:259-633(+)
MIAKEVDESPKIRKYESVQRINRKMLQELKDTVTPKNQEEKKQIQPLVEKKGDVDSIVEEYKNHEDDSKLFRTENLARKSNKKSKKNARPETADRSRRNKKVEEYGASQEEQFLSNGHIENYLK